MQSPQTASVGAVSPQYAPNQTVSIPRLTEQLRNDTFETDSASRGEADLAYRRGWNACAHHIETEVLKRLLQRQRVLAGLGELVANAEVTR